MASAGVRVLDVSRVKPLGSDSAAFSIPFTLFDTYWFKLPPTELLLFYPLNLHNDSSFFQSVLVPRLKHSLALTLAHYLPLVGTLTWPSDSRRPAVLYSPDDAGVSFTVTESCGGDFNSLSGAGPKRSVDLHSLIPLLESSRNAAQMLSVQVTLFPNQGFSIGLENHSTFCDGLTLFSFLKTWARTCSNEMQDKVIMIDPPLSFDRSSVKDPTGLDLLHLNQWRELIINQKPQPQPPAEQRMSLEITRKRHMVPSEMVRATFELTPQNITALKEKILLHNPKLHLSTFLVFLAYAGTYWIKCKQMYTQKSTVRLGSNVNFRALSDPQLPVSYFGRCVGWRGIVEKTEEFTRGLGFAAERLSQVVQEVKQGGVSDDEGVTKVSILRLKEMFGPERDLSHVVTVAGSGRLEFYGLDYGWGRPVMVDLVHIDRDGAISMVEKGHDKDGKSGGVEVAVALNPNEMDTFASLFLDGLPGKGAPKQIRKISKL